ncbi:MAG: hypothetical protein B7X11_05875, partial [Acidobacteria bacterium 37-65-4]
MAAEIAGVVTARDLTAQHHWPREVRWVEAVAVVAWGVVAVRWGAVALGRMETRRSNIGAGAVVRLVSNGVGALAVIILLALWGPAAPDWLSAGRIDATPSGAFAFGAALIPILFAYGGWQNANYVAEEMRDPARHLPRALIIGTAIVVLVYLLANVAYLRTLGLAGLAGTETPAADASARWLGAGGARFVAAAIAVSTFGFLDLAILAPTRVYYAMASDGAFFPALAKLHPRFQTPGAAIVLQSFWAIVLVLTGKYGDLLNTVVFADW